MLETRSSSSLFVKKILLLATQLCLYYLDRCLCLQEKMFPQVNLGEATRTQQVK